MARRDARVMALRIRVWEMGGTATGKTLTGVKRLGIAASTPRGPPLPPVADLLLPLIKDFPEKTEKNSD